MNVLPLAPVICALLLSACSSKPPQPQSQAAPKQAAAQPPGFERSLELQGIRFKVSCPNSSSVNKLVIAPAGLEVDNSPITRDVEGTATGAEIADLNVDGSPEIYIYLTSAGSGSYGTLAAYSVNRRKSLSEIFRERYVNPIL